MARRDKINYYLDIAETVLERGTCLRRNFGAIIVANDQIISTGYVGAPRGRANCIDMGYCTRWAPPFTWWERNALRMSMSRTPTPAPCANGLSSMPGSPRWWSGTTMSITGSSTPWSGWTTTNPWRAQRGIEGAVCLFCIFPWDWNTIQLIFL